MEALGVAASIIAVVQISKQIINTCTKYIEGINDAPKDLRYILIEVSTLKGLFEPLKILIGVDAETAVLQAQLTAPVEGCLKALSELDALIGTFDMFESSEHESDDRGPRPGRKRRRLVNLKMQLAWPLKQDRAKRLLELLGVYKSTINLLLSSHGISHLQKIGTELRSFREELDSVGRARLLNWLVTVNPSLNHNQALDLHQQGTCEWVLKSDEWESWRGRMRQRNATSPRGLWIHGIPGAGKTILSSFLATKLLAIRNEPYANQGPDDSLPGAAVYYYCHHSRGHDERSHFLAWLVSQLCRQAERVPENLRRLFEADCMPTVDDLVETLTIVSGYFGRILISIDAVDESQNREVLAEFLNRLATDERFKMFYVVITSRREVEIERHLANLISLFMSNTLVDKDIDEFIDGQLNDDPTFRRWSNELRFDIKRALVSKAHGMFRWVVCQLELLRRIPFESDIRKVINELPETLDETYCRILTSIPTEWRPIIRRALCFLILFPSLPLDHLLYLTSYSDSQDELMEETPNQEAFLEKIGCLVISTPTTYITHHKYVDYMEVETTTIRLAHYTIAEYLEAPRLTQSSVSFFYLPTSQALQHSVRVFFKILSCETIPPERGSLLYRRFDLPFYKNSDSMHHFASPAELCRAKWPDLLGRADTVVASQRDLAELIFGSLDPRKPYYRAFYGYDASPVECLGSARLALEGEFPDNPEVAILANLICQKLYATTAAFLLRYTADEVAMFCAFEAEGWGSCPLLGWLARDHHGSFLLLLLERCSGKLQLEKGSLYVWAMEVYRSTERIPTTISTLISANVPVNPVGVRVTPLQIAVRRLGLRDVKLLVQNGADPNGVGHVGGWVPGRLRFFEGGMSPLAIIRDVLRGLDRGIASYCNGVPLARTAAKQIEEFLVKAGGQEVCEWRVVQN
ncbi:hypothetical protein OQA88_9475 [Cercophora sp. LCS_1]